MIYSIMIGVSVFIIMAALIPEAILDKSFSTTTNKKNKKNTLIKQIVLQFGEIGALFYINVLSKNSFFKKKHDTIEKLLVKNWYPKEKASDIVGSQWLLAICSLLLGMITFQPLIMLLGLILIFIVQSQLESKWKKRKAIMGRYVLSLAELTAVGVSAGLPPIEALQMAIKDRDNFLFDEIQDAINKVRLGVAANKAFMDCSKKVDLQEMFAFMDQLIQAIDTGSSGFSESVVEIVKHLRELRQAKIEEIAGKTEAKLLLPLMMIFGSVISFLLGPLTLTFRDVF
ncbi:type II secretion system F family protein [Chengkuizengella axinellae]|uniref:Type II secretion system F family protein n=1 Tax=Chengkuizengella axinellae TaxID=3064388 RepID=A0ABT9J3F5_9BACL|nr:type II secretion system F family protein [Chengkuizengella sp. 2205SS18-9]MDP5276124.1 type II secretion system F family protein [Chengkuizengella sp. 2205SS18-9]